MVIRPRKVDFRTLKLSAEEGFVLSRLSGPTTMRELVALSNLEEARVEEIVQRLATEGAIEIEGAPKPTPPSPPTAARSSARVPVPPAPTASKPKPSRAPPEAPAAAPPPMRAPVPSFAGIDELDMMGEPTDAAAVAFAAATDIGRVRTNNEDAFITLDLGERGVLLGVADGMGGANAGEIASRIVVDTLRATLGPSGGPDDPAEALRVAVEKSNTKVIEAAAWPGREGMGATLIAVLVRDGVAYSAEVGDSRFYVLRGGALTQVSKDQTYTSVLVEQGVLTPEDAKASRAKNVVLQACGRSPELIVAQRRVELAAGDVLLLCSDGLSGEVEDPDSAKLLGAAEPLDATCANLIAAANAHGGKDNVTVVVARIAGEPPEASTVDESTTLIRAFTVGG